MTLAELLPAVQQLPLAEKRKLIRILAEEVDGGDDIAPLVPHHVYELPTPYDAYGAAGVLLKALECDDSEPQ
jgi:hypothetical protein